MDKLIERRIDGMVKSPEFGEWLDMKAYTLTTRPVLAELTDSVPMQRHRAVADHFQFALHALEAIARPGVRRRRRIAAHALDTIAPLKKAAK